MLNVFIPPKRASGYHRHSLDSVGVLVSDTERTGQVLGAEATVTPLRGRGSANFTSYAREPLVHTVAVTGDVPFHNIVVELMYAEPGRFTAGTRGEGYSVILDNERVRVWRLALEPGQAAACDHASGARSPRRHRRRRDHRERARQARPREGAAQRRVLLAGCRHDARRAQRRIDAHRARRARAQVDPQNRDEIVDLVQGLKKAFHRS